MANRKMGQSAPPKKQFSLDMDAKGLFGLLAMAGLTMAVVFYLGMIYGKAQRDPSQALSEEKPAVEAGSAEGATEAPAAADGTPTEEKPAEGELKVYEAPQDDTGLGDLNRSFQALSAEAEKSKQAEQEDRKADAVVDEILKVEKAPAAAPAPAKPPTTAPKATTAAPKPANWPDTAATKGDVPLYTVQVLATKNKDRADAIVDQLKKSRFDAYTTEVEIENTKIYRVRVGKDEKEKIVKVKDRLEPATKGLGTKLTIYQIN